MLRQRWQEVRPVAVIAEGLEGGDLTGDFAFARDLLEGEGSVAGGDGGGGAFREGERPGRIKAVIEGGSVVGDDLEGLAGEGGGEGGFGGGSGNGRGGELLEDLRRNETEVTGQTFEK